MNNTKRHSVIGAKRKYCEYEDSSNQESYNFSLRDRDGPSVVDPGRRHQYNQITNVISLVCDAIAQNKIKLVCNNVCDDIVHAITNNGLVDDKIKNDIHNQMPIIAKIALVALFPCDPYVNNGIDCIDDNITSWSTKTNIALQICDRVVSLKRLFVMGNDGIQLDESVRGQVLPVPITIHLTFMKLM